MNRRRAIALLALLGALDSSYLLLEKLGFIGTLACGITGGCDVVNTSEFASLLGIPVAAVGLAGYLILLGVALLGVQPRWVDDSRPDKWLSVIGGLGLVFSVYLTYAELFVIGAICQWCLLSQFAILAIFVLAVRGVLAGRGKVTA